MMWSDRIMKNARASESEGRVEFSQTLEWSANITEENPTAAFQSNSIHRVFNKYSVTSLVSRIAATATIHHAIADAEGLNLTKGRERPSN